MILLAHLTVLQNQEFAAISWNLIKIAIFKDIMAIVNLEMIKIYEFVLESAKYPNSNIHFICSQNYEMGFCKLQLVWLDFCLHV